jgi:hypothetical protein
MEGINKEPRKESKVEKLWEQLLQERDRYGRVSFPEDADKISYKIFGLVIKLYKQGVSQEEIRKGLYLDMDPMMKEGMDKIFAKSPEEL